MSLQNPAALIADKLQLDQNIPPILLQETQSALRLFKLKHPNGSLGRSDNDLRRACALLEYVVRERGGIKIPMKQLSRAACMRERDFMKFHQTVGNFRRGGRVSRAVKKKDGTLSEARTIPSLTIKLGSYIQDPNGVAQRALKFFQTLTKHAQELPATERGHQLRDIQDHRKAYEASCFFIAATTDTVVQTKPTHAFDEDDNNRLQVQSIIDASNDFTPATFKSILQHVQSIFQQTDSSQHGSPNIDAVQTDAEKFSRLGRKRASPVQQQSDRLAPKLLVTNNGLLSHKLALNATTDLLQQASRQLEESMEVTRFEESGSKLRQKKFDDWKRTIVGDTVNGFNKTSANQEQMKRDPTKTQHCMEGVVEEILRVHSLNNDPAFVLENGSIAGSVGVGRIVKTDRPENLCCATFQDEVICDDSMEVIENILDESSDTVGSLRASTIDQFLPLMLSLCRSESSEAAMTVDNLLGRLEMEMEAGNENVVLTNKHYTIAIDAWGKAGHDDAPRKAEIVMERFRKLSESNPELEPTRVTYNALMNAHAKLDDHERISTLLDEMESMKEIYPTAFDYNVLLAVYARLGRPREAEQIVQRMIDRSQHLSVGHQCYPDLYSYNMLLDAWSRSNESNRGKRAEDILNYLCDHSECSFLPDRYTYMATVSAVVRSGEKNVIERVERLINKAKSEDIDSDVFLESQMLGAYALSSSPGSADKAEKHLNKLQEKGIANAVSFNTVLKAWKTSNDTDCQERAESLLGRMKELGFANTISYSTLISIYAKKGDLDSAERADAILSEMSAIGLSPNVWTLNAVMSAWVRCGRIRRAEDILDRMEQGDFDGRGEDGRIGTVAPNVVSYTTLMNGWAKSKDPKSGEKTEEVFRRMVQAYSDGNNLAQPNLYSFVTLIDSLVHSKTKRAAEKAESVLLEMYEEYKDGNLEAKPNAKLVSMVVECWQKSGENDAGARAEALLNWLIEIYESDNDEELMPNEFTFTSTISAWAKTRKFGKAGRARAVLVKMIEMHESGVIKAKPNTHAYTAVINSCAYCENDLLEKRDSLHIAVKTYKEMMASENAQPNQVTFATVLTALRNLMPADDKRAAAAKTVFQHCIDAGLVTDLVLRRLQSTLNGDQLVGVVGSDVISSDGTEK